MELGIVREIEVLVLSRGCEYKQVKVTDIFVINTPERVLILGGSWFKYNVVKVDFPNKTLTLLIYHSHWNRNPSTGARRWVRE